MEGPQPGGRGLPSGPACPALPRGRPQRPHLPLGVLACESASRGPPDGPVIATCGPEQRHRPGGRSRLSQVGFNFSIPWACPPVATLGKHPVSFAPAPRGRRPRPCWTERGPGTSLDASKGLKGGGCGEAFVGTLFVLFHTHPKCKEGAERLWRHLARISHREVKIGSAPHVRPLNKQGVKRAGLAVRTHLAGLVHLHPGSSAQQAGLRDPITPSAHWFPIKHSLPGRRCPAWSSAALSSGVDSPAL